MFVGVSDEGLAHAALQHIIYSKYVGICGIQIAWLVCFVQLEEASTTPTTNETESNDADVRCATPPCNREGDVILSSEQCKEEVTSSHGVDNAGEVTPSECEEQSSSSPVPPPIQEVGPAHTDNH